jgi:TPR repeat protein
LTGQKAYLQATDINEKLYSECSHYSESRVNELYRLYFRLLKKAAYLGHTEGQYDYAQQFENMSFLGLKNPLYNSKKCIFWYTKACSKGHAEAFNSLAIFYEKGEGCKTDLKMALEFYRKSAEFGSPNGKRNYKIMIKDLAEGGKYHT